MGGMMGGSQEPAERREIRFSIPPCRVDNKTGHICLWGLQGGERRGPLQTPDPRPAQIPSLTCRGPAPPLPFPLQHFLFPALFHLFTCSALLTVYFHSWTEHSLRAEKVLSYWPCIHQGRAEPVFPVA